MLFTNSALSVMTCFSCGRVTNCSNNISSCSFILVSCDILHSNRKKEDLKLTANTTCKVTHFCQKSEVWGIHWDFTDTQHLTTTYFFPLSPGLWALLSAAVSSKSILHVKPYLPIKCVFNATVMGWPWPATRRPPSCSQSFSPGYPDIATYPQ